MYVVYSHNIIMNISFCTSTVIKFSFDQDRRFTINEYEFGSRPYPVRIEDFDTNPVRIERGSITIAYQIITPPTNATEGTT